jgi:PAS domain S-box-containing protein
MYEHAEVGIVITSLERRFLRGNPAIQRMLGYSEEELQQIDVMTMIFPQDQMSDAELFEDLAAGKRDAYNIEKRYIRKDGSVFWARLNYSLVRAGDGSPRFAIGILEDIDSQKQALQDLEQSEARFRAMFEHAIVAIALISLERRSVTMNPAAERMLGYSRAELTDQITTNFIYAEDVSIDQLEFSELVQGKRDSYTVEKRYVHKSGAPRWGRITHSLVRGADGQPLYILSMMEDIDEQKHAQERMAARDAEYRQLLEQTVLVRTHELREANTLLEQEIEQRKRVEEALAVKAAEEAVAAERNRLARDLHDAVTQTLFSASLTAEVLPELWKMDEAEALRCTEELRQLTRGALAEMRTLLLELRPATLSQTPFEDLLRQLVEALIGRARLPVRLEVQGSRRLPPDVQIALYRIAQESLNNVVKYARASEVVVSVQMSPAGVHMEIRDDGVGFDPEKVPAASLGQRIMRERAENINADLEVTSAPGKGAMVVVTWTDASVLGFLEPPGNSILEDKQ